MGQKPSPEKNAKKALIKQTFEQRHQSAAFRYRDPAWEKKENRDSKPDEKTEPHASNQALIKGNLARGCHLYIFPDGKTAEVQTNATFYAWNAWNYIGSSAGSARNVYKSSEYEEYRFFSKDYRPNFFQAYPIAALGDKNEFLEGRQRNREQLQRRLDELKNSRSLGKAGTDAERDKLEYSKLYIEAERRICFRRDRAAPKAMAKGGACIPQIPAKLAGASLPYAWQAHHLISVSAFYEYFSTEEIQLILTSNYDVNDGRNVIFLPREDDLIYWKPHKLPSHAGPHPKYDKQVEDFLQAVKENLKTILGKSQPHENATATVEEKLHEAEQTAFEWLVSEGKKGPQKLG